jgi:hypothetical protein
MFTARTVVVIVALCAGGVAASSASAIDDEFSVPAGTTATSTVARPAIADELTPTNKPAPAAMASTPIDRCVTAQKVTEDTK